MNTILHYKKFNLGNAAVSFIENRLKVRTALSDLLCDKIDFNDGEIFTFFPDYIDENKLTNYSEGSILPVDSTKIRYENNLKIVPISNTTDGLVDYIYRYLSTNNNIAVIENFFAAHRPSKIGNKIIKNKDAYYYISNKDDKETILKIIKKNRSFAPGELGIFTELPLEKQEASGKFLEDSIKNIKGLFLEAYDGEGYIIWKKNIK